MRSRHSFAVLPLVAAYLVAATTPCPRWSEGIRAASAQAGAQHLELPHAEARNVSTTTPEASHAHHAHADPTAAAAHAPAQDAPHHHAGSAHASARAGDPGSETALTAPCPCGCEGRGGSVGVAKRLGPIVLPVADAALPPPGAGAWLRPAPAALEPALAGPDPIPIAT